MSCVGDYEVVSTQEATPNSGGFHNFTVDAPSGKVILGLNILPPSDFYGDWNQVVSYWYPSSDGTSATVILEGSGSQEIVYTIYMTCASMGN